MDVVEVDFHPETFEEFFGPVEAEFPGFLADLKADFARYQQSDCEELPDYFGFDAPYGSPPEIAGCIEHIHLCLPPRKFPAKRRQFERKCRTGKPEDDIALVYARGLFETHRFVIIGILWPDAHKQGRDMNLMARLGRLGRQFRNEN
ncbi:MAG: type II toxin-antitoxin system YafO family toxin [Pseudomonadaceae bacterium]|jgi:mRNA interferase YafO